MAMSIFDAEITQTIEQMQSAARNSETKKVKIRVGNEEKVKTILRPFPSPGDWRDHWIYFLMIDRFNNPAAAPKSTTEPPPSDRKAWNEKYDYRQGGTFNGVRDQLDYIKSLGARAIWLSPVLKNPRPDWEYNYHGYWPQDFLNVDERFASDGTLATAEKELTALVDEAHARDMYVILDIVINHAGRVFDYVYQGKVVDDVGEKKPKNPIIPVGQELPIRWMQMNGSGNAVPQWLDVIPVGTKLKPDDAVWPSEFQRRDFFRRRGKGDEIDEQQGFVVGDFAKTRQLVVEYLANAQHQKQDWEQFGNTPVLSILIRCYQYLIAKYDIDGLRLDATKHVHPEIVEIFGNAMREFALSIGKRNFFTFGEIAAGDEEKIIAKFVGRNTTNLNYLSGDDSNDGSASFGIDAALDFPLFTALRATVKGPDQAGVERLRELYEKRREQERELLSSHGEAGRYFVTFIDNHDRNERFDFPGTPAAQVTQVLTLLFCLQGIPCLYYGTEQGLHGTIDPWPDGDFYEPERVREALWGNPHGAFNASHDRYKLLQILSDLRAKEPALRYGRQYFRPVAGDGVHFGPFRDPGGVIAFSRLLVDREILVIANTNVTNPWDGSVVVDLNTNRPPHRMEVKHSNVGSTGMGQITIKDVWFPGNTKQTAAATLEVKLKPMEVQILIPA